MDFVKIMKEKDLSFNCLINNAAYGADHGYNIPSIEIAEKTLIPNVLGTM